MTALDANSPFRRVSLDHDRRIEQTYWENHYAAHVLSKIGFNEMIAKLDAADGDTDLEPSLGAPELGAGYSGDHVWRRHYHPNAYAFLIGCNLSHFC